MVLVFVNQFFCDCERTRCQSGFCGQQALCVLNSRFTDPVTVPDLLYRQGQTQISSKHFGTPRVLLRDGRYGPQSSADSKGGQTANLWIYWPKLTERT